MPSILATVASRLGVSTPSQVPGLAFEPGDPPDLAIADRVPQLVRLRDALAQWAETAAERRRERLRFQSLSRQVRRLTFSPGPTGIRVSTWTQQDVDARAAALSISSFPSVGSRHQQTISQTTPSLEKIDSKHASLRQWVPVGGGLASRPTARGGDEVTRDVTNLLYTTLRDPLRRWKVWAVSQRSLHEKANKMLARRSETAAKSPWPSPAVHLRASSPPVAELRADALSITSSSAASEPEHLPFTTPDEAPDEIKTHEDFATIRNLLNSRVDHTLKKWRRCSLYTDENWQQWAYWHSPARDHRDANEAGRVFSDRQAILTAPDLRSADTEAAADAWNTYRRYLLIEFRSALTVGFRWTETLARLSATLSDPNEGYPRLANYIDAPPSKTPCCSATRCSMPTRSSTSSMNPTRPAVASTKTTPSPSIGTTPLLAAQERTCPPSPSV